MNNFLSVTTVVLLLAACAAPVPNERNEKFVFITKASFESNLGGLSGADAKCQAEADAPESIVPSGTYLPWLSDGTDSPDTRFTRSSHPYLLADETKIAENYTDLTDGSILHAINVDATGAPVFGSQRFWTDTLPDGTPVQSYVPNAKFNSCNAWNGTDVYRAFVIIGNTTKKSAEWSNAQNEYCKNLGLQKHRLACFQQ